MTKPERAELRALLAKATPGPWTDEEYPDITSDDGCTAVLNSEMGFLLTNDAAFIVAARNHLGDLLDQLDAAELVIDRYRSDYIISKIDEALEAYDELVMK